jgi:hypothetical protein
VPIPGEIAARLQPPAAGVPGGTGPAA